MTARATSAEIAAKFPQWMAAPSAIPEPALRVKREGIAEICAYARNQLGFEMLIDLSCVDYREWEEKQDRFEVLYNLFNRAKNERLLLKAAVPEDDAAIDSVVPLWPAADWYEREVWDMFGVKFRGHPNLKRILLYEEFKGHALRKDYPHNFRQPLTLIGPHTKEVPIRHG